MYKIFPVSLLLLLFGACQSNQNPQNTSASDVKPSTSAARKTILFFGNSLTAAYQLAPEQGFPALIQNKIDSLGLSYTCVNAGVSGETTLDGLNRIEWVLRDPVDIFVLELGANDALRGLPLKDSKHNLEGIMEAVKAKYPACRLMVAGMLAPPNLGEEYTQNFREMYSNVAHKHDATLIPFLLQGVAADPKLNLEDGIHPNIEGHKIVAENVWKVLQPLL